jgi:hypothetical protein
MRLLSRLRAQCYELPLIYGRKLGRGRDALECQMEAFTFVDSAAVSVHGVGQSGGVYNTWWAVAVHG